MSSVTQVNGQTILTRHHAGHYVLEESPRPAAPADFGLRVGRAPALWKYVHETGMVADATFVLTGGSMAGRRIKTIVGLNREELASIAALVGGANV